MNEALKQFSTALADDLRKKLETEETKEFIKATKASGDDRSFEVVMSTSDEDRQGDELDQSKWDLKYFEMNPVVLWAHDYGSFPIGVVDDIRIDGDQAIATGKFAPAGVNPEADMACALYQEKILRTVSPGYIQNDDGTRELLEMSFCPVPAGRYALSLRQVGKLGVSTGELVAKGFFYEEKKNKSPQIGDRCETDDGTVGILADDDKNPGALVCVPSKSNKSESMNNELEKKIKAEDGRHGKEIGKAIDEFKAIDDFEEKMDSENADHLNKCMKAIDESYELEDQKPKKTIDEFKSDMKAEHLKHVKCFDKAIDEFKSAMTAADGEDASAKAIDEFTKSASAELDRHEKAHGDLMEEHAPAPEEEEKALADAIVKSGRAISAKNRDAIEKVIKALEDHHTEHGKAIDDVTAALKAIMASGDGGEEPSTEPKGEEKALNERSSTSGATAELETYLFTQRLVRQVKTATEGALRQINDKIKKARTPGR
jgi:hypothetical protein